MTDLKINAEGSNKGSIKTGAVGAGSGTIIVFIANELPESAASIKNILLYLSPTLTIVISAVAAYISYKIVKYFYDKDQKNAILEAKSVCHESLKNANTSNEHKEKARKSLEQSKRNNNHTLRHGCCFV